jgi:hypothetical protein
MANSNRYILKYDQENRLYNYVELSKYDVVLSYIKLEDKTMIRYDRPNNTKQMVEYKNNIELKQRFSAGSSFVSVYDSTTNSSVQYNFPEMTKQITLINNLVSTSNFGQFVLERYNYIQKKKKES